MFRTVPESYSKCFDLLFQNKFISAHVMAAKMGELAKFRNLIVHIYWKVDNQIVISKLDELFVVENYFKTIHNEIINRE